MDSTSNPDDSGSTRSCDQSGVVTKVFEPASDFDAAEWEGFRLTEAEYNKIRVKEI